MKMVCVRNGGDNKYSVIHDDSYNVGSDEC